MAPPAITVRIVVVDPPAGVVFRLQSGKTPGELIAPVSSTPSTLTFELVLTLGEPLSTGRPRFLGPAAQGTPDQRFVYICSGTLAGQAHSPWTRRAKVHLSSITRQMVESAGSDEGHILEASFLGTAKDGGPSCASVPLIGGGWHLVPDGRVSRRGS